MASPFFEEATKALVVDAVRDVESKTSAEIVVSLRAQSETYRDVDIAAGAVAAIVAMFALMFVPVELDEYLFPVEALLLFALVSALVGKVPALKRRLVSVKRRTARVLEAARAHFVEAGVDRTRDRSGILVFVSLLEREVTLVPDRGIDPAAVGAPWDSVLVALRESLVASDPNAFARALKSLGDPLGAIYPRKEDDTNELPDAPDMRPS